MIEDAPMVVGWAVLALIRMIVIAAVSRAPQRCADLHRT
jgi:hypothetical protein